MPTQANGKLLIIFVQDCGFCCGSVRLFRMSSNGDIKLKNMNFLKVIKKKNFLSHTSVVSLRKVFSVYQDIPTFSAKYRFGGQFTCSV